MHVPTVAEPLRYRGLYVFDFGDWCAVGYTAEEIAVLLEEREFEQGKVFRIRRAWPDGRMELQGVSRQRFSVESGTFFPRRDENAARDDFAFLRDCTDPPPPCRASLQLATRPGDDALGDPQPTFVTALIYPAEYEDAIAAWLLEIGFEGGDLAEGGIGHVDDYRQQGSEILDRAQLWGAASIAARSADEVLRSVRRAVQR